MERFLSERTAFVVGGSGGIGAGISEVLAGCGAHLRIHGGHSREKLDRVAAAASDRAGSVSTLLHEINSPADATVLLEFAGAADVLVVAFGPWLQRPVAETGPGDWDRMVGLNLTLPALLVSGLLPGMVRRGYGRIILFGGPRSDRNGGYREIGAYGAAKHGLASLVRSVAVQHAADNVRCNMICPGYVRTEYYDDAAAAVLEQAQPTGRFVRIDEIAGLVVTLLAPASDAVNGAVIPVDFGV